MVVPITPGTAGVSPDVCSVGDRLFVWAGLKDSPITPKDMQLADATGKVVAAGTVWGESQVCGNMTAPLQPGTYNVTALGQKFGTVTVLSALPAKAPVVDVPDPDTFDYSKVAEGTVLRLPRGRWNLTRPMVGLPKRVTFDGCNSCTLVIACPANQSCFRTSTIVTFRDVKVIDGNTTGRFVCVDPGGSLKLDGCLFSMVNINNNGGCIINAVVTECRFIRGASVDVGNGAAVLYNEFTGRPRIGRVALHVCGDGILAAENEFHDTERGILATGNITNLCIAYSRFTTSGQTNQKESPLLAEDVTKCVSILFAGNRCEVDGGISLWALNSVGQFQAIYLRGNRFKRANEVLFIKNSKPGGIIADIYIKELHCQHCSKMIDIDPIPDATTNIPERLEIYGSSFANQMPTPNSNGDCGQITAEDFNPVPANWDHMYVDPSNQFIVSTVPPSALTPASTQPFVLSMVGCDLQTKGNRQTIMQLLSPTSVMVRNGFPTKGADLGAAFVDGLVVINGPWKVSNSRFHRCISPVFSPEVKKGDLVVVS